MWFVFAILMGALAWCSWVIIGRNRQCGWVEVEHVEKDRNPGR